MVSTTSKASWVGKAAYEIMQIQGWSGTQANMEARYYAEQLGDWGINLERTEPRNYVRSRFGFPPLPAAQKRAHCKNKKGQPRNTERRATSKASWLGMAAQEIDEITTFGATTAAKLARDIANHIIRQGYDLLAAEPRAYARLHFGPEAMARKKKAWEEREARRREHDNRMSDYLDGTASNAHTSA